MGEIRYMSRGGRLLFTENETNTLRVWGVRRPISRMRFTTTCRGANAAAVTARGRSAASIWFAAPAGGASSIRIAAAADRHGRSPIRRQSSRAHCRGREFYDVQHSEHDAGKAHAAAAGIRRPALGSKQYYHYGGRWLQGDPASLSPPPNGGTAATPTGSISTTPTSSRCPTNGNIRGTPPGIWRFTCSVGDGRSGFRQEPACRCSCANGTCIRMARFRRTNGHFGDVNPPVHAWACWRVYQDRRQAAWRSGDRAISRTRLS